MASLESALHFIFTNWRRIAILVGATALIVACDNPFAMPSPMAFKPTAVGVAGNAPLQATPSPTAPPIKAIAYVGDYDTVTIRGLAVPIIPTVIPKEQIEVADLPPEEKLRIGRYQIADGTIRMITEPKDYQNNGPGDVQPLIDFFRAECMPDQSKGCVLVQQFHTRGGTLLEAGYYGMVAGMMSDQPTVPPSSGENVVWAVIDSNYRIIASGKGGEICKSQVTLSACLFSRDGKKLEFGESGFVIIDDG